jgi:hypothetical protein
MPSEFFNPADHLLDLVSVDPRLSARDASQARVTNLISHWRSFSQKTESGEEEPESSGRAVISNGEGSTRMTIALPVVLERSWRNLWRRKDVSMIEGLWRYCRSGVGADFVQIFFNRLVQTPLLGGLLILFFQRLTNGPAGEHWCLDVFVCPELWTILLMCRRPRSYRFDHRIYHCDPLRWAAECGGYIPYGP